MYDWMLNGAGTICMPQPLAAWLQKKMALLPCVKCLQYCLLKLSPSIRLFVMDNATIYVKCSTQFDMTKELSTCHHCTHYYCQCVRHAIVLSTGHILTLARVLSKTRIPMHIPAPGLSMHNLKGLFPCRTIGSNKMHTKYICI